VCRSLAPLPSQIAPPRLSHTLSQQLPGVPQHCSNHRYTLTSALLCETRVRSQFPLAPWSVAHAAAAVQPHLQQQPRLPDDRVSQSSRSKHTRSAAGSKLQLHDLFWQETSASTTVLVRRPSGDCECRRRSYRHETPQRQHAATGGVFRRRRTPVCYSLPYLGR
jgi:hypothetical protein